MLLYRILLLAGATAALSGCAASMAPPSVLCLASCALSRPLPDNPPAPPMLPPPVPVAVSFAPAEGGEAATAELAKRLLDALHAERRLVAVPTGLSASDLASCPPERTDRARCLSDVAKNGKLTEQVIVLVGHPGSASRAAKVTCIGPDFRRAREESIDLQNAFDGRFEVANPPKTRFTSCLIGAVHGPPQPD